MIRVRPIRHEDADWVRDAIRERWGSHVVVAHGDVYEPSRLPGFVAEDGGRRVGLLTYVVEEGACEIVTLDALEERRGVGTALVEAAMALGHRRLWLVTTNDNTGAQRFYERLGFRRVAVHEGAVERSRELKPEIPRLAGDGTPIRDELEFELQR
jgi:ribosomal protein S18 acetylase RimI-like enzyme